MPGRRKPIKAGGFVDRLYTQMQRLDQQGVRYATSAFNVWINHKGKDGNIAIVKALKIRAKPVAPIPEGHHRAGEKSKIYVDEVVVY